MRQKPKPIRWDKYCHLSIPRIPREGALTPRLRQGVLRDAIGFHHNQPRKDDDRDDDDLTH